jgi:hypothetical protein
MADCWPERIKASLVDLARLVQPYQRECKIANGGAGDTDGRDKSIQLSSGRNHDGGLL